MLYRTAIYFKKIHPRLPMIHRPRYLAAASLAPASRPPICLQYMIWCHAASVTDKYSSLHSIFYERARKYAELDELEGLGERVVSIAHCQTWVLIGTYEFKMMFLPRAWLSVGKAARLATMLGLCGIDEDGLNVKQTLPPSKDWSEKEERRRVFWMAFCLDRYASVGTGWPVSFDERDVSCSSVCFNVREQAYLTELDRSSRIFQRLRNHSSITTRNKLVVSQTY